VISPRRTAATASATGAADGAEAMKDGGRSAGVGDTAAGRGGSTELGWAGEGAGGRESSAGGSGAGSPRGAGSAAGTAAADARAAELALARSARLLVRGGVRLAADAADGAGVARDSEGAGEGERPAPVGCLVGVRARPVPPAARFACRALARSTNDMFANQWPMAVGCLPPGSLAGP
jgi:hypothetical protein